MQGLLSSCQHFASQNPGITQKLIAVSQIYWKPEYGRLGENFTYNKHISVGLVGQLDCMDLYVTK